MSDRNQWDNENNESSRVSTTADPYTTESSADIYQTPDVSSERTQENEAANVPVEEVTDDTGAVDTKGLFSGSQPNNNNPYGSQPNNNNPYGSQPGSNNPYGGQPNSNNPYGGQPNNNNPYGGQPNNNNPYGGQPNNNNPYGGQPGSNNPYGGQPSSNNPYGGQPNNSNPYGGQPGSNNPYGGQPGSNNPYGGQFNNNTYGNQGAQNGAGYYSQPNNGGNYNYQYSPYAAPQKKSNTGLIIAVIVIIIVLFLVAVFALAYKAVDLISEQKHDVGYNQDDYNFDDDDYDYGYGDDDDYGYGDDDYGSDYGYGDDDYDYDDDHNYDDDKYYTLHDDIKDNLSYSIDYDYYEYDTDYEYVSIIVTYPIIKGNNVPNLDKLNEVIQEETTFFTDYFEEEYEQYVKNNDDGYFDAFVTGYVTYMDEEKLSIVFSESVYSDYYDHVYLYCINIDMENGVVLDNEDMLSIDDDFSVDFRTRSDEQNGEISYLTAMTDQQITDYFNSPDVIVFYTPQGMEIGFNYEQGWVTVTYDEYEKYLKVF